AAAAGAAAAATAAGGHGKRRRELAGAAHRGEARDQHPGLARLAARADLSPVSLGERGQDLERPLAVVTAILVDRHLAVKSNLEGYERLLASRPGLVSRSTGDPRQLVEDSLVLLDHLGDARTLIDVGSGGGMPGIPLKIARPHLAVTLVEADRRKAAFLVHVAASLGLDLAVVADRAETAARGALREAFDVVVCRALAPMPVLVELCLPFPPARGRLLAM